MSAEKLLEHFREQAMYCTMFGSPFTGELVNRMADDLEGGGPVADLVGHYRKGRCAEGQEYRVRSNHCILLRSNRTSVKDTGICYACSIKELALVLHHWKRPSLGE